MVVKNVVGRMQLGPDYNKLVRARIMLFLEYGGRYLIFQLESVMSFLESSHKGGQLSHKTYLLFYLLVTFVLLSE